MRWGDWKAIDIYKGIIKNTQTQWYECNVCLKGDSNKFLAEKK